MRTGGEPGTKGNTSFSMAGVKKSVNLEINWTNSASELLGYETVNLNNAAGTVQFSGNRFTSMSCTDTRRVLRARWRRFFINGANWGVYSLAQQEDGDLIREWFRAMTGIDGARRMSAAARRVGPGGGTGGGPGGGTGGGPGGGTGEARRTRRRWRRKPVRECGFGTELAGRRDLGLHQQVRIEEGGGSGSRGSASSMRSTS